MNLIYDIDLGQGLFGKYKMVASRLPPGSSILELGCHTGYFSKALMALGHTVIGVESNSDAVEIAQRSGVQVLCENVENPDALTSFERTFDAILLMDILEHLREPVVLLKRLRELLNEHGRILVTGPNVAFWGVRRDLPLGKWNYTDAGIMDRTHLHFYTASTWRALLESSGLTVTTLESAIGQVPLAHHLGKIPGLKNVPSFLDNLGVRLFPNLFTNVFLIEATPNPNYPKK